MLLLSLFFSLPVWAHDGGVEELSLVDDWPDQDAEELVKSDAEALAELNEQEGVLQARLASLQEEARPIEEEAIVLQRIAKRLEARVSEETGLAVVFAKERVAGELEVAINQAQRALWAAAIEEVQVELEEVFAIRADLIARRDAELGIADAQRLADAERLQAEARQAIEDSRQKEEAERDEQRRQLLALERAYAEELLEIVEQESEQIRELIEDRRMRAELYARRRATIQEALESDDILVRDEAVAQILEFRREAREGLWRSKQVLAEARQSVTEAETRLRRAKSEQDALERELGVAFETSELARRRMHVAQVKVEVAARGLTAAQGVLEAKEEHHAVFEERARFYHQVLIESFDEISPELRRTILDLRGDSSWRDTIEGVREAGGRIGAHIKARRDGIRGLSSQTGSFIFWGIVINIAWRLMVVVSVIWFIRRDGARIFNGLIRTLLRRPYFRRHPAGLIKFAELVRVLLIPLILYGAAKWILIFAQTIFIEALYLGWALDVVAIYWLVMAGVRVLVLRRDQRERANVGPAPDLGDLGEESEALDAFIKATGLSTWRGLRVVRAIRLLLVMWLVMVFLPRLIWSVVGPSPLWLLAQQLTRVGLFIAFYFVMSWWKKDMMAIFVGFAGERMPRAVAVIERHQDRFYGVFLIALGSLYVLLREGIGRWRVWMADRELNRQVSNFIFRKKIEIQQRGRGPQEEEVPGEVSRVPMRYRDLFETGALWDESYLVEREGPLEQVTEHFQRWYRVRRMGAVAIIGESGIGKTTLLNQLVRQQEFHEMPIQYLTLWGKQTRRREVMDLIGELFGIEVGVDWEITDLVEAIKNERSRVIIIDECHQLFMRHIGGFHGMDAFLDLVHRTNDRHFWVLAFNHYPWIYLNRVQPREHLFGGVLQLSAWTEAEIEELIDRRNQMSDFEISFTDLVVTHENKDQQYVVIKTSRGYFRLLQEYSQGNPAVAQAFWLRSLRMNERQQLQVGLFQRPAAETFEQMADQYLFALAAIVQHGVLSADEIARVISIDRGYCATALNYLREYDIVDVHPATGRAQIRRDHLRLVMRQLAGSNFLYE